MATKKIPKAGSAEGAPTKAKGKDRVVLYALIDGEQHRALRVLSFMKDESLADLVREAIDAYLAEHGPSADDVEGVVKSLRRSVRSR